MHANMSEKERTPIGVHVKKSAHEKERMRKGVHAKRRARL